MAGAAAVLSIYDNPFRVRRGAAMADKQTAQEYLLAQARKGAPAVSDRPRSTVAIVVGAILMVFSLLGLVIGVQLAAAPLVAEAGYMFVVVSILIGAGGGWLIASGSAKPTIAATPAPSRIAGAAPDWHVGAPSTATSEPTDVEPMSGDDHAVAVNGSGATQSAAGDARLVGFLSVGGLAILVGLVVWHASTVAPSMASRVQSATHAKNVSCYLKGEINMGDGVRHQFQFFDCISWPPTSTLGPTTVGCYVYYHGRLADVTSRLAHHPNSWDTWNLFMAPPSGDPLGNVCGSYTL